MIGHLIGHVRAGEWPKATTPPSRSHILPQHDSVDNNVNNNKNSNNDTTSNHCDDGGEEPGSGGDTGESPNDASGVVWALGEFFFFYFFISLILTNVLQVYTTEYRSGREMGAGGDENRPKRHATRRLGSW